MRAFTLDEKGVVAALLLGVAILIFGGVLGPYFLLILLLFLMVSAVVTDLGKGKKELIGVYEKARGWKNVLANGGVPLALAILFAAASQLSKQYTLILPIAIAYTASISAVMADKFASEVGVLDGVPVMLLTLRKVSKGTSGAVTWLGTIASALGSAIIALCIFLLYNSLFYFAIILVSGFVGSVVDTVFGYFEEQHIGNKYTSNLACAVAGALLAVLLLLL